MCLSVLGMMMTNNQAELKRLRECAEWTQRLINFEVEELMLALGIRVAAEKPFPLN